MLHRFDTNPETALPHLQRGTVILFLSTSEISLDDTQTLTHWKLLRAMLLLMFSCSVMLDSLQPHRLDHARLLCPTSSPGKNTEMSCYLLLQGIFPTQKSKLCLLLDRRILSYWAIREAQVLNESESCSVVSNSLWPHELYSPWNSPGQNTGVGSLSLLQGIFPTHMQN